MIAPRILIAGVGNIFLGDDAFGVEVVQALAKVPLPASIHLVDFGIRGLDLVYALLEGYETVILIDAMRRGGPPGQVYVIEPEPVAAPASANGCPPIEMHRLDPARVLELASAMGCRVGRLLVVGCEPALFDEYADIQPGLSEPARAAVPIAVQWVQRLVKESLAIAQEDPHEVAHDRR